MRRREQDSLFTEVVNPRILAPAGTLFTLIYASSAVELFSPADLVALLQTSRRNNTAAGITGMLLYKSGNFIQALEGEEEAVRRLHAKIAHDPRHRGLLTLTEHTAARRQFGDWSMGFRNLSDPTLRTVPGYNEFLNASLDNQDFGEKLSRAGRLLATFRRTM